VEKWRAPLDLHELLIADFSTGELYEEQIDWQATMFQPVGGMDRIAYAFAKSLEDLVHYDCPVKEIRKTSRGVRVSYTNGKSGAASSLEGDYCICTLPISVLQSLDTDFSAAKKQAFHGMKVAALYKIGWEAPRFWEKQYNIYGGLSFLKQTVDLVWYPSAKLFSKTGVILSGFNFELNDVGDGAPTEFGKLSTEGKLEASRRAVDTLHPGHGKSLSKPIYVSWSKIPYSLGCFGLNFLPGTKPAYDELSTPDGRLSLAGDYISHLAGWQEGAALSAHRAVEGIAAHMRNS
jgi:monoamine oxidase